MKMPRKTTSALALAPFAAAATFAPGFVLKSPEHVLPTSHQHFVSAPRLAGPANGSVAGAEPLLHRDPTFNPAVHAALYGAAGYYGAAAIDFIVQLTKRLVTAAEDVAESSSSDSSSSGSPSQQAMKHLFPSGDQQFNVNQ